MLRAVFNINVFVERFDANVVIKFDIILLHFKQVTQLSTLLSFLRCSTTSRCGPDVHHTIASTLSMISRRKRVETRYRRHSQRDGLIVYQARPRFEAV